MYDKCIVFIYSSKIYFMSSEHFDVIVIGAGHAGVEAALSAKRVLGSNSKVALVTFTFDNIGQLSCNPSIGGVGKGHIVKEIDAMGGAMGYVADKSLIHFKLLNSSKGPAVWGPRAQVDRKLYKDAMQSYVLTNDIVIIPAEVTDLVHQNGKIKAIVTSDSLHIYCSALVIASGTFLGGKMHIGANQTEGGRIAEYPSKKLAVQMKDLGFNVMRLKTGTPPRLKKNSINWDALEIQKGDIPQPFSSKTQAINTPQVDCYITYTNSNTHEIINNNLLLSPMYNGTIVYEDNITSMGPRYCPSIEDKIVKFKEKDRHQVFLEPEGLTSDLIYPNGISTSLPESVQIAFLKTIKGLEKCEISQPGYAIEYDAFDPRDLDRSLQSKKINGLYFAGQINGTTGYEEAAGQGLVAGANAALYTIGQDSLILGRHESYIGVMIDDLVSQGVSEPYRMMTSRAEFRIKLRADNAQERLSNKAFDVNLINAEEIAKLKDKDQYIISMREKLQNIFISPQELEKLDIKVSFDGSKRTLYKILGLPNIDYDLISKLFALYAINMPLDIFGFLRAESIYALLEDRLNSDIKMLEQESKMKIPTNINYHEISGLSNEIKERLSSTMPESIAHLKGIRGVTPSAVIAIIIHIKKYHKSL